MKVTYQWLKDFVEIKITPPALADQLTMAGLEVTAIDERAGDFVFEIEVTANRPDCLSVVGIAREVAAISGKKLKWSQSHKVTKSPVKGKRHFAIEIQDKKDCPLYTAKIIRDVRVGPSPEWLKKRLELISCRSVNNIVDITNYILFTYGQPLHAFDLDKLKGEAIIVRRGKPGEKITTIDAIARMLNPDILVIADREKPVAIAGIMGGAESEVTSRTKNILLESAVFNPIIVRRSRQKLGLQSESSYRFERGVDVETAQLAAWQAVHFIQELCAGRCIWAEESGLTKAKKKKINLSPSRLQMTLGMDIPAGKIKKILEALAFKVRSRAKNNFLVEVPASRQDISLEVDLMEEVARIFGYAQIPTTLPRMLPALIHDKTRSLVSDIKNILVSLGLNEVITYSLIGADIAKYFSGGSQPLGILNPLSNEQSVLRPSLIPGLLKSIATNLNQKQIYINLFEIAKTFSGALNQPKEELTLGVALCGVKSSFIAGQGLVKEEASLLHLKGLLENLFLRLGIAGYHFSATDNPEEFEIYIGKDNIGKLLKLPGEILTRFEIKNKEVLAAELFLDKVLASSRLEKKVLPLPKYPGITRDISFMLKDETSAEQILEVIRHAAGLLLEEAKIIDYYQGQQIPAGFKGLTVSCVYRSGERTLIESEINPLHQKICAVLSEEFGAKLRA